MTRIFENPVLKAIPAVTMIFVIGTGRLVGKGNIPTWLWVSVFVVLAVLNILVIYSSYKQNPKAILPKILVAIFFIALALGIFLFQFNDVKMGL
jgi:hypothetical protein